MSDIFNTSDFLPIYKTIYSIPFIETSLYIDYDTL